MTRNIALILVLLGGLLYLLHRSFPDVLSNSDNILHIVQAILILSIIILGISRKNIQLSFVLKGTLIWLLIALAAVSGYSYRYQLQNYYYKVMGNIIPSMAIQKGEGEVNFRKGQNGHFNINAHVNGNKVRFLVDTGATMVALTARDAMKSGFDINRLNYNKRVSTANGVAFFASVRIGEMRVGDIVVKNVPAYIARTGLDSSLLGMSFLSRLREYEVTQDTLTLRQ